MLRTLFAIYVNSRTNIGDAVCAPTVHVPSLHRLFDVRPITIGNVRKLNELREDSPVIVGGGGLLANKAGWDDTMRFATERSRLVVGWGLGLNRSLRAATVAPKALPGFVDEFELLGLRDSIQGRRWVPCSSALSPEFGGAQLIQRKYGVFLHLKRFEQIPPNVKKIMTHDNTMTNEGGLGDFSTVIAFLRSSDIIVTNSYHGMYWATLLGKRTLVFDTFSEKFITGPWSQEIIGPDNSIDEAVDRARIWPEALEEARSANQNFAEDVLQLFG